MIWTILFLAIAGAIAGIILLLVPKESQTDKFWLSISGLGFGLFALYVAFAFRPSPVGEQGGTLMRGTLAVGSLLYFMATIVLALVAISPITFPWLGSLHILALLGWIVLACVGALGATALAGADRRGQQGTSNIQR